MHGKPTTIIDRALERQREDARGLAVERGEGGSERGGEHQRNPARDTAAAISVSGRTPLATRRATSRVRILDVIITLTAVPTAHSMVGASTDMLTERPQRAVRRARDHAFQRS